MVIPVVMIVFGIVFLAKGAYLINGLVQQGNHYRRLRFV
ncbi:TPA: GGDEF domain-containing protein, partial [Legionella pneumophila]|nr:GGDEF domain-containing protein [Legionella pneumophila]